MWANVRSVLDIAIVAFIIYRILALLVGTRAIQIVKGAALILILWGVATFLHFRLLSWVLTNSLWLFGFALPIVFQPEMRKMLEEIGRGQFYLFRRKISADEASVRVKQIAGAVNYLKAHKIGALLVFQREVPLVDYSQTAIHLNANITQELIISIFWKNNPLHDGAIILNRREIIAGGCYLPLADVPEISRWYGTRHRAGLGISEVSDAIVLIVSEQHGEVSLAAKGRLSKDLKDVQVERLLTHYFAGEQKIKNWSDWWREVRDLFWTQTREPEAGGIVK